MMANTATGRHCVCIFINVSDVESHDLLMTWNNRSSTLRPSTGVSVTSGHCCDITSDVKSNVRS